jgi:hypothetical protein
MLSTAAAYILTVLYLLAVLCQTQAPLLRPSSTQLDGHLCITSPLMMMMQDSDVLDGIRVGSQHGMFIIWLVFLAH